MEIDSHQTLKIVDLLIAEVTTPATGLGIEIGLASVYGKRILCIYKRWAQISNSLKSVTKEFIEYENPEDIIYKIGEFLRTL